MAGEIASAYVSLLPKFDGKALKSTTGRAADDAGQSAGKAFGGSFAAFAGKVIAAAGIFKGVSAAGRLAKEAIFDFNSQLQNSSIAFTTMLGSGEKAKGFLDELQAFAKSTPFEFGDLVKNTQTMMGMGVAAKDVIPFLTGLGDSVASVGGDTDTLNNTILAFSQTMAKGTLDMGNMNQLLQGGMPSALKVLAASYGVTTGEMVKMISAGKVQSSEALPKLIKGLEEGTSATAALGGMMDKQSATFSGALGNISDGLTQTTAHAFKPFFDFTTKGLMRFADLLGSDAVSKFADHVNASISSSIKFVSDGWGRISDVVSEKSKGIRATLSRTLAEAPAGIVLGWRDIFSNGFGLIANKVSGFARDVWAALKPQAVDTYRAAVDALTKTVQVLQPYVESVFGKLRDTWDQLVPVLPKLMAGLSPVGALLHGLLPVLPTLADAFGQIVQSLAGALLPVLPPLADAFGALVSGGIKATVTAVVPLVRGLANLLQTVAPLAPAVLALWGAFKLYTIARGAIAAVILGVGSLVRNTASMSASVVGNLRGMASAGNLALAGLGLAVGGLVMWWSRHEQAAAAARARVDELTSAIEQDSGALGENTRQTVVNRLAQEGLLDVARKVGVSMQTMTDAALGNNDAIRAVNDALREHQGQTLGFADGTAFAGATLKGLTDELGKAESAYRDKTAAMGADRSATDAATVAMNSQTTASDMLRNALDRLSGKAINAEQAELSLKQSAFSLTEQVKQAAAAHEAGATSLDDNTAAGLRNRQSLLSLIQQANAHAQAVADQTGSVKAATDALSADEAAIRAAAKAAGLNATETQKMIDKYAAVPKDVNTSINLDISGALGAITRFKNEAGSITGIQVGLVGKGIGANAAGTDDWRGGLTVVGENGPEIVALPPHSSVINNRNADKLGGGMSDEQFNALLRALGRIEATTASVGADTAGALNGVTGGAVNQSRGARGGYF